MTGQQIVEVDPHDESAVIAWREVMAAAARHEVGQHATIWTEQELLAMVQQPGKARRTLLFNGLLDGEVVAAGSLSLRLLDNVDAAEIDVAVRPDVRRRGLGSQMLVRLEEMARTEGRTRFEAEARWPYAGPSDGAGTAGVEFAQRHGYSFGLGDVQRELDLPVDDALLAELAAEASPYHAGYEIRSWEGPVPDDLVVSWLELSSTLMTEAPTGAMEREAEAVDVGAHRESEEIQAKQGRTTWHTVALDRDGTVVAYTQLVVSGSEQQFIFQWGTLVHREHRGHRLGMAVKVANHRFLQAGADVTGRRVATWNAEVNDHMIGINERLGYATAARNGELQKKLV
ncbi:MULTISPECIES: GNAT family N-acetyltransferase [Nocardioides]|uniref:GNAT family N-acetyltransferase n=1 Tax=Nocardioides vastitatis TaxID=2568655 RepID=A0ABW0ZD63_9ACTN|nr:GNAT family N-acetyltransferase [Nocardioides sp.]THJ09614.1 GNAT family N-acetyltransferase [Nocardioides sp.]